MNSLLLFVSLVVSSARMVSICGIKKHDNFFFVSKNVFFKYYRFGDPSAAFTLHIDSLTERYANYLMVMQHFRKVLPQYTLPPMNLWGNHPNNGTDNKPSSSGKQRDKNPRKIKALVDVRYESLVANPEKVLRYIMEEVLFVPFNPLTVVQAANSSASTEQQHSCDVSSSSSSSVQQQRDKTDTETAEGIVHKSAANYCDCDSNASFVSTNSHVRVVSTASRLQVKERIYTKSVGRWRKYAAQLQQTLIPALEQHLPRLARGQALPFLHPDSTLAAPVVQTPTLHKKPNKSLRTSSVVYMNWALDPSFNYTQMLIDLRNEH
jgi:hypothetical protein